LNLRFLAPAREELRDAVAYLNKQEDGLGQEFLKEVGAAIQRIEAHPTAWASLSPNTRRCRTNRFKYGVIYEASNDEIVIVAVAHLHREPTYWQARKNET
jgi:mRNA-degrading endonuclease RelE of RelBE toxin-antitoxin system